MDNDAAREALARADKLAYQTVSQGRWLVRYYVIFGIASLLIALAFGVFHGTAAVLVLSAIWLVVVVAISVYANTRKAVMRGMGRLHAWVMTAWTLAWLITVSVGAGNGLGWPWFLSGGLAMLIVCLAGAFTAYRRTSTGATA